MCWEEASCPRDSFELGLRPQLSGWLTVPPSIRRMSARPELLPQALGTTLSPFPHLPSLSLVLPPPKTAGERRFSAIWLLNHPWNAE